MSFHSFLPFTAVVPTVLRLPGNHVSRGRFKTFAGAARRAVIRPAKSSFPQYPANPDWCEKPLPFVGLTRARPGPPYRKERAGPRTADFANLKRPGKFRYSLCRHPVRTLTTH